MNDQKFWAEIHDKWIAKSTSFAPNWLMWFKESNEIWEMIYSVFGAEKKNSLRSSWKKKNNQMNVNLILLKMNENLLESSQHITCHNFGNHYLFNTLIENRYFHLYSHEQFTFS